MKFLVADDHQLIREGLKHTLERIAQNSRVFEARDGDEVLRLVAHHPDLDLILLDFFMPGTNGYSLISTLCNEHPDIPVIVISASDDPLLMRKALDRGVAGFISKATDQEVVLEAIKRVLSGGIFVPPDMALAHLPRLNKNNRDINGMNRPISPSTSKAILARLTRRQREVLELIVQGKTNKDISRQLQVSENTVKVHVTAILKVLGVANRTQAVIMAQKLGLPR